MGSNERGRQRFSVGRTQTVSSAPQSRTRLCAALLVLLIGIVPAIALADEPSPSSPEISVDLLQEAADAPSAEQGHLTDSQAANELPHRDLDREEAVELTEAVFDPILEDAVGPIQGLEVEKYLGNYAAIVPSASSDAPVEVNGGSSSDQPEPGGEKSVLMESTLPLRTEGEDENQEPVDLSLESSGDSLEPKAALVDVELPQELGEGIRLPELGIEVRLPDAPEARGPSIINDTTAFYPNVATDTDFSVVPTPTGFETLTTLRTPQAPRSQTFQLNLPPEANLREVEGGAQAERNGKTILKVLPPSAIDASGASVPVSLAVEGSSLVLTTSPSPDAVYPILVDPLFESYDWYAQPSNTWQDAWQETRNASGMEANRDTSGLYLHARHEFPYKWGDQVNWWYSVPRLKAEEALGRQPTSFLQRMTVWHLAFVTEPGGLWSPYLLAGILGANGWAGKAGAPALWAYGGNGPTFYGNAPGNGMLVEFENGEPGKRDLTAKRGTVALASGESTPQSKTRRLAYFGAAFVEVGDEGKPSTANGSISSWVNQTASSPITATAEDTGLGVKKIGFDLPWKGPQWATNSCLGTVASPCPLTWTASLPANQYNPAEMPQGFVYIPIDAEDVLGSRATQGATKAIVKVDHTKPALDLSGTLTEQAKVGTTAPKYTLKYTAADGDSSAPLSLAPVGVAGTGEGKMQRPMGVAVDASGNTVVVDRECACVQKYDTSGKFLSQFGSFGTGNGQFSDPRGIAISPNGTIWVSDSARKNVQAFNSGGQFIRKVTFNGFVEPYALAVSSGGTVFLADPGAHKLFRFQESGAEVSALNPGGGPNLVTPVGIAIDATGRIFVVDNATNKVSIVNQSGELIWQFGSEGTGNVQFKAPVGIAVAPSGHVLVADAGNNRVQVFQPTGSYLRQFGSGGAGNDQLNEPRGLAVGPGNVAYIADASNKRIAKWSHADHDAQSGAVATEVKLDGNLVEPKYTKSCSTNSCPIEREWTLNADNYPVGQHNLEVTATDGVGLATTKALSIETHGDLKAPAVALSGSMTEQAALGTTRPTYKLKLNATDPGGADERKSGVASTTIKVDGSVQDSVSPGCAAGGCSITREWTLNSDSYSVGAHTVQVTATDAAGRTTTQSFTITISRDKTPPQITATNSLFTAPEGWVEQLIYNYTPSASDTNGYGVTSFIFKIDNAVVDSRTPACPGGGCSLMFSGSINMSAYAGGSHPAELIATDGAGNVAKKTWTINVDPAGVITVGEVTDTLEALEVTDDEAALITSNGIAIPPAERAAGNDPVLTQDGDDITVEGVPVETELTTSPSDGISIPTLDGEVQVEPIGIGEGVSDTAIVQQAAAVTPNTSSQVDTVFRPLYSGITNFNVIRGPGAPQEFSWKVQLHPGQALETVDARTAQVVFEDGTSVMMIRAESARDATGKEVPTGLQVIAPNAIQLTVSHKGGGYSYPVSAGPSFEVGYSRVTVIPPPSSPPSGAAAQELTAYSTLTVGAPEPVPASEAEGGASASSAGERRRPFLRSICGHNNEWFGTKEGTEAIVLGEGRCGNGFDPINHPGEYVLWRGSMRGMFLYTPGQKVRHRGAHDCVHGTPGASSILIFAMKDANECRYGPSTADGNGGASATIGHYLRAQAHWELGHRNRCPLPESECPGPENYPWSWEDKALELHLFPSGIVREAVSDGYP